MPCVIPSTQGMTSTVDHSCNKVYNVKAAYTHSNFRPLAIWSHRDDVSEVGGNSPESALSAKDNVQSLSARWITFCYSCKYSIYIKSGNLYHRSQILDLIWLDFAIWLLPKLWSALQLSLLFILEWRISCRRGKKFRKWAKTSKSVLENLSRLRISFFKQRWGMLAKNAEYSHWGDAYLSR